MAEVACGGVRGCTYRNDNTEKLSHSKYPVEVRSGRGGEEQGTIQELRKTSLYTSVQTSQTAKRIRNKNKGMFVKER